MLSGGIGWGIFAMVGYGTVDFLATIVSRKTGSFRAFFWMQLGALLIATPYLVAVLLGGGAWSGSGPTWYILGLLLVVSVTQTLSGLAFYRGVVVGSVAVVAPVAGSFGIVTVGLSMLILGERPTGVKAAGVALTLAGIILTSTDVRQLLTGQGKLLARGAPYGLVCMVSSGVTFLLLTILSRELGWFLPVYVSRGACVMLLMAVGSLASAASLPSSLFRTDLIMLGGGALDMAGTFAYSIGTNTGMASLVAPATAAFPLVTVLLARFLLSERIAPNQTLGIGMVIVGLVATAV